jgi:hypothetical protein
MEAIMRERNSNSRIALRATAGGGERFALVLDGWMAPDGIDCARIRGVNISNPRGPSR